MGHEFDRIKDLVSRRERETDETQWETAGSLAEEHFNRGEPHAPGASATVRVLVVDDHFLVRRGAISLLRAQRGFEIVGEAESGSEAEDLSNQFRPEVVLLDVILQDQGGFSAARNIMRACPEAAIVAFSASADPVYVRGMLAAGARAYVLKASEPEVLLTAIRSVRSGSRFLDPGLSDALIEEFALFPEAAPHAQSVLTRRETQVLERIVWGYTNAQVAAELAIRLSSVNTYRIRLREKLGLTSRTEMVRYGVAVGLMSAVWAKRPPAGVKHLRAINRTKALLTV